MYDHTHGLIVERANVNGLLFPASVPSPQILIGCCDKDFPHEVSTTRYDSRVVAGPW